MAQAGQLRYLNLNTTFNSTIQLNYRQTELAFWTVYLPTVIGRFVPTYPPITEVILLFCYQLHAVSRTQQDEQREPVKTLFSPLFAGRGVAYGVVELIVALCLVTRAMK